MGAVCTHLDVEGDARGRSQTHAVTRRMYGRTRCARTHLNCQWTLGLGPTGCISILPLVFSVWGAAFVFTRFTRERQYSANAEDRRSVGVSPRPKLLIGPIRYDPVLHSPLQRYTVVYVPPLNWAVRDDTLGNREVC